jgi:hypothetical protein
MTGDFCLANKIDSSPVHAIQNRNIEKPLRQAFLFDLFLTSANAGNGNPNSRIACSGQPVATY